jgi:hypothetical protein
LRVWRTCQGLPRIRGGVYVRRVTALGNVQGADREICLSSECRRVIGSGPPHRIGRVLADDAARPEDFPSLHGRRRVVDLDCFPLIVTDVLTAGLGLCAIASELMKQSQIRTSFMESSIFRHLRAKNNYDGTDSFLVFGVIPFRPL